MAGNTLEMPNRGRIALTVKDYRDRLRAHREVLRKCMEYEYGLSDIIARRLIFTEKEMEKLQVKSHTSPYEVNKTLLQMLKQRVCVKDYEDFMYALTESLQSHLVQLIYTDGNFPLGEEDRPLTEEQRMRLRSNRPELVRVLANEVSSLVDSMFHEHCINELHKIYIENNDQSEDKVLKLLDIVQNRSVYQFQAFRRCLRDINAEAYELTSEDIWA